MKLLTGRYSITVDGQGRLALPASWRLLLYKSEAEPCVHLVKDPQYPTVRIYLPDEYSAVVSKCAGLPEYARNERKYRMQFCGGLSVPLRGDRLMLVVSDAMRSHIGCQPGDKVEVTGEGNFATIWRSDLLEIMLSGEKVPGATEELPLEKGVLEAHGLWSAITSPQVAAAAAGPVAAAAAGQVAAAAAGPVTAAAAEPVREEAAG